MVPPPHEHLFSTIPPFLPTPFSQTNLLTLYKYLNPPLPLQPFNPNGGYWASQLRIIMHPSPLRLPSYIYSRPSFRIKGLGGLGRLLPRNLQWSTISSSLNLYCTPSPTPLLFLCPRPSNSHSLNMRLTVSRLVSRSHSLTSKFQGFLI